MVRIFAFLLSLISADQAHAQPALSPDAIDKFFSVVSTGTAAEVAEALKREPALATSRDSTPCIWRPVSDHTRAVRSQDPQTTTPDLMLP